MVTFNIRKLGPITNSKIEYNQLMLFSGESGRGKSYAAFLVYYLERFLSQLENPSGVENGLFPAILTGTRTYAKQHDLVSHSIPELFTLNNEAILKEVQSVGFANMQIAVQPLLDTINKKLVSFMGYLIGDIDLECDVRVDLKLPKYLNMEVVLDREPVVGLSLRLSGVELNLLLKNSSKEKIEPINFNSYLPYLIVAYTRKFCLNQAFTSASILLPPARGGFMGANYSTLEAITSTAGMYKDFLEELEKLREPQWNIVKEHMNKEILYAMEDIMGGSIKEKQGQLFYEFEGKTIPITAAASSIKELAALFLLLGRYRPDRISVLFEEPEAHLHPGLHVKLANLITLLVNQQACFQVTTHSDYFLGQINNLIKLHRIRKQLGDEKFNALCLEKKLDGTLTLDSTLVNAYFFKKRVDGSVEIVKQDTTNGVPFDTFEKVVSSSIRQSMVLDDYIEAMQTDSKN